jgi:hypothetical protein
MSVVPQRSTYVGWRLVQELDPTRWNPDIETEVDLSIVSPLQVLEIASLDPVVEMRLERSGSVVSSRSGSRGSRLKFRNRLTDGSFRDTGIGHR